MPVIKLSRKALEALLNDYAKGVPVKEISRKYGVHHSYPTLLARRMGMKTRKERPNSFFKEKRNEL